MMTMAMARTSAAAASNLISTPQSAMRRSSSTQLSCQFMGQNSVLRRSVATTSECRIRRRRIRSNVAMAAFILNDEGPKLTEEEIEAAYEAKYGPAFGGAKPGLRPSTGLQDDDTGGGKGRGRKKDDFTGVRGRGKDGFEETVVQVRRVTKVVKGGKQLSFRVITVVGNKNGVVGVGIGKAKEVISAVQKSVKDAKRHLYSVPLNKHKTFPHRMNGHYGAADVMLRPASPGTGVIAGGAVKIVLQMAGVVNALGKQLGSDNYLNNARATIDAINKMKTWKEVSETRGIPLEELWRK